MNNGGPAFPRPYSESGPQEWDEAQTGMSLRDWFAGQALIGICATNLRPLAITEHNAKIEATVAYYLADAMLGARKGKTE